MKKILIKIKTMSSWILVAIGAMILAGLLFFAFKAILVNFFSKEETLVCNQVDVIGSSIKNSNYQYIFKITITPDAEHPFSEKIYDVKLISKNNSDRKFITNENLEIIASKKSENHFTHLIGGYLDKQKEYTFLLMMPWNLFIQKGENFWMIGNSGYLDVQKKLRSEEFKNLKGKELEEFHRKLDDVTTDIKEIIEEYDNVNEGGFLKAIQYDVMLFSLASENFECENK